MVTLDFSHHNFLKDVVKLNNAVKKIQNKAMKSYSILYHPPDKSIILASLFLIFFLMCLE